MSVTLIDHMGTDESVARAAWVSTQRDDREATPEAVERLIRTLFAGDRVHAGPMGHPHLTICVECPIFVSREWFRHRTWSYSEISTRYVDMSGEAYLPAPEDVRAQVGKRISYQYEAVPPEIATTALDEMAGSYRRSHQDYQVLLSRGVAREVARNVLPLGTMTRFYGTVSLRNALAFVYLRNHPAALLEIRREAEALEALLHTLWPVTMRVWTDKGRPAL
jgi:thymidylate synthase (FAD)